jgi:hypothetical protein
MNFLKTVKALSLDKIICNMATMPSRTASLAQAVESIIHQCDELHIYLNDFDDVPDFLQNNPKVKSYLSKYFLDDLGDVGKFFRCDSWKGYVFTLDDDIIYPADYCRQMITAIERYQRKAVITCHGRKFRDMPVKSYYHNNAETFVFYGGTIEDKVIHIPGTGVMAFHSDTLQLSLNHFQTSNMADIWMALHLQKHNIPAIVIKHLTKWIRKSNLSDAEYSIYYYCHMDDQVQTDLVNSIKWQDIGLPAHSVL